MEINMVEYYKALICELLPKVNDETFLHEIYVEILKHSESQEVQDEPSD